MVTAGPAHGSDSYGSGQSFLFSFNGPSVVVSRPTGANSLYQFTTDKAFAIGGGGRGYGLYVADGMLRGASHCCATYQNELLSSSEDFQILQIEVWGLGWKPLHELRDLASTR